MECMQGVNVFEWLWIGWTLFRWILSWKGVLDGSWSFGVHPIHNYWDTLVAYMHLWNGLGLEKNTVKIDQFDQNSGISFTYRDQFDLTAVIIESCYLK